MVPFAFTALARVYTYLRTCDTQAAKFRYANYRGCQAYGTHQRFG